jgi:hypothetical protein
VVETPLPSKGVSTIFYGKKFSPPRPKVAKIKNKQWFRFVSWGLRGNFFSVEGGCFRDYSLWFPDKPELTPASHKSALLQPVYPG